MHRVRMIFFVLGVVSLLLAVPPAWGWSSGNDEAPYGLFVAGFLVVVAVASFLGVAYAPRQPLPWALALAGLATLVLVPAVFEAVAIVASGEFAAMILLWRLLPRILLAAATWGALKPALALQRLIAENPDDASLRGELDEGQRRRNRAAGRALLAQVRSAAVIGVVILAAVVGAVFVISNISSAARSERSSARDVQPDVPLEPTLGRFEAAWRRGDLAALSAMYSSRLDRRGDRLERRFSQRGLEAPFPELRDRQLRNYGRMKQAATYSTERGKVEVVFEHAEGAWELVALRLPD